MPRRHSRVRDLLDRQGEDLAALTDAEAAAFVGVYEDARRELREQLAAMVADGRDQATPATAQHVRVMLAQMEDGVRRLRERLGRALGDQEARAHGRALADLLATIKTAEPEFKDTGHLVENQALRKLTEQRGLLLHKHSVDRYTAELMDNVQRQIAIGMARGQTVHQIADRIAAAQGSVFAGMRARADLIARMEMSRAYDAGHQASLGELATALDEDGADPDPLMKRADEFADKRSHPFSMAVHGMLAPIDGEWWVPDAMVQAWAASLGRAATGILWERRGGFWVGGSYPAHYNDRGRQTAWRKSWGDAGGFKDPKGYVQPRVVVTGTPDNAHEEPQARRVVDVMGGGRFDFEEQRRSVGIEGWFTPYGRDERKPVSLKSFGTVKRLQNIIGKLNVNAHKVASRGLPPALFYAQPTRFTVAEVQAFAEAGPIARMPSEGVFDTLVLECRDGVVIIDSTGVRIRPVPPR